MTGQQIKGGKTKIKKRVGGIALSKQLPSVLFYYQLSRNSLDVAETLRIKKSRNKINRMSIVNISIKHDKKVEYSMFISFMVYGLQNFSCKVKFI